MLIEEMKRQCGCDPGCQWVTVNGEVRAIHVLHCAFVRRERAVVTFTPKEPIPRMDIIGGITHFDQSQRTGDEPV